MGWYAIAVKPGTQREACDRLRSVLGKFEHDPQVQPLPETMVVLVRVQSLTAEMVDAIRSVKHVVTVVGGNKPVEIREADVETWLQKQGTRNGARYEIGE